MGTREADAGLSLAAMGVKMAGWAEDEDEVAGAVLAKDEGTVLLFVALSLVGCWRSSV
jgi:hypothetical protein